MGKHPWKGHKPTSWIDEQFRIFCENICFFTELSGHENPCLNCPVSVFAEYVEREGGGGE